VRDLYQSFTLIWFFHNHFGPWVDRNEGSALSELSTLGKLTSTKGIVAGLNPASYGTYLLGALEHLSYCSSHLSIRKSNATAY